MRKSNEQTYLSFAVIRLSLNPNRSMVDAGCGIDDCYLNPASAVSENTLAREKEVIGSRGTINQLLIVM